MRRAALVFLAVIFFLLSESNTFAAQIKKIAVFPVDVHTEGSSFSIYSDTISLIANDIINSLNSKNLTTTDLNSTENALRAKGLYKSYKKMLTDYKNSYTLDYDACSLIAKELGVDRILFVSGGFDTQNAVLKRNLLFSLDIPGTKSIIPMYKLQITLTLIDPQSGIVVWENTYNKDFAIENFAIPSQYLGSNVVPIEKIKKFSSQISAKASDKIVEILAKSEVTEVNSNITSTKNNSTYNEIKDESTTRDGHLYSNDNDSVINNKKNTYKEWVKQNLQ